ncbi:MAG: hypothetical protein JXX28_16450 [Deltaproteobacteria bacterium]|nr:hypothetical protein [Deltaproteobacteria bacterium]
MSNLTVALSTSDGETLFDDHFGQAPLYLIASLSADGVQVLGQVENPTAGTHDHGSHGDGGKAGSIGMVLKQQGVQVLAGRAFGGNIVKMRRKFAVALLSSTTAAEALTALSINLDALRDLLAQGEERSHINLR